MGSHIENKPVRPARHGFNMVSEGEQPIVSCETMNSEAESIPHGRVKFIVPHFGRLTLMHEKGGEQRVPVRVFDLLEADRTVMSYRLFMN